MCGGIVDEDCGILWLQGVLSHVRRNFGVDRDACAKFIGAGLGACCLLFVWYGWLRRSGLKIFSSPESSGMGARCISALRCRGGLD